MKINLGGTCGTSNWRETFIQEVNREDIQFVNPVVSNWTWNNKAKLEKQERIKSCDYLVYFIAPSLEGFSSVASVVDYSNKYPQKVLCCIVDSYLDQSFSKHQIESLKTVKDIIQDNGCKTFESLEQLILYVKNL